MKQLKYYLIYPVILLLFGIELVKCQMTHVDINWMTVIIRELLLIFLLIINQWKLKKNTKYFWLTQFSVFILALMSMLSTHFSAISYILLYLFIIFITAVCMIKTKFSFETSMVVSVTFLILLFILAGILNLLPFAWIILLIITVTSLYIMGKNKEKLKEKTKDIAFSSILIFTLLFLMAIVGGVGRYVHSWDEYSYWGYAAKVAIQEQSLYAVISRLGAIGNYPPVSTIWHYIVSVFTGFHESNLYIGLSILTFIYMMPIFSHLNKKKPFLSFLFVVAVVFSPMIFNGSLRYSLIYVDLLLGILCASSLILWDQYKEKKQSFLPVALVLIIMTWLKTNGFVFSLSLLLLFYLQELLDGKITWEAIFTKVKKFILPGILIILVFISWRVLANVTSNHELFYDFELMPDTLKPDLIPKLDFQFILNFCNSVLQAIDESILYGFIEIPLFMFLIGIGIALYFISDKKKENEKLISLIPYGISYIVFYLVTALSLFVMFSLYEASELASFGRYLAPINIALLLFVLYKFQMKGNEKVLTILCLVLIAYTGFTSITFFATDIKARRETMHVSEARSEMFQDVIEKTEEDTKVFVINQEDTDTIMPLWYARYYCYPRIINSSSFAITWKIKTESNEWDLQDWGLTEETFEKHILEEQFDYVFFYTTTDELIDLLEDHVEVRENLEEYQLFEVENRNGNLWLNAVK